jgi:hypothetical protein
MQISKIMAKQLKKITITRRHLVFLSIKNPVAGAFPCLFFNQVESTHSNNIKNKQCNRAFTTRFFDLANYCAAKRAQTIGSIPRA